MAWVLIMVDSYMLNLLRVFAAFIFAIVSLNSYAVSTEDPKLNELVRSAEFVGVIEVVNINKSSFQDDKKKNCGYVVEGKVIESLKGPKDKIRFFVEKDVDLLADHDSYFLMAFDIEKGSSSSYRGLLNECGLEDIHYVALSTWQTIYAFGVESDQWVSESALLAGRRSVFSHNAYYTKDDYIDHFVVLNERIYAVVMWKIVKEKIVALLKEEKPSS